MLSKFLSKVRKTKKCWLWLDSKAVGGYGMFFYKGAQFRAHRFSYEVFIGKIPSGLHIDHLCRNPACVNPEHLEAVTSAENTHRGVNVKLNAKKVEEIVSMLKSGKSVLFLSKKLKLSVSTIYNIKNGKSWWIKNKICKGFGSNAEKYSNKDIAVDHSK